MAPHGLRITSYCSCSCEYQRLLSCAGIGNVRQGLHPVQEALSKSHGSQCGFCTPGFVMSMYALLRSVQGNGDRPLFLPSEAISRSSGYQFILQESFIAHLCPYYSRLVTMEA